MWSTITSDIKFDQFGDIEIIKDDIKCLHDPIDILQQNVIDRIKSSYGDYDLDPNYGSNITELLGKANAEDVEKRAVSNIISCLTYDKFIPQNDISVFAKKTNDSLIIKLEINTHMKEQKDKLSLTFMFGLQKDYVYAS